MGTRCITTVKQRWNPDDEYEAIVAIYRHWDGYPDGQGKTLAEFLDDLVLVNGIGGDMPPRYANGPGILAAQLVCFMQDGGHSPDLAAPGVVCGQEFEYDVLCDYYGDMAVTVVVRSGPMTAFGLGGEQCSKEIFRGPVSDFKVWVAKDHDETE